MHTETAQEMSERIKRLIPAHKAEIYSEVDRILAANKAKKQARIPHKVKSGFNNICKAKQAVEAKKKVKSVKRAKIAKASRKRNRK